MHHINTIRTSTQSLKGNKTSTILQSHQLRNTTNSYPSTIHNILRKRNLNNQLLTNNNIICNNYNTWNYFTNINRNSFILSRKVLIVPCKRNINNRTAHTYSNKPTINDFNNTLITRRVSQITRTGRRQTSTRINHIINF